MRIRVTILGVILLSTGVILLWPPQEERLTSEEELNRLVEGITAGQILYLRRAIYRRPNPEIPMDSPLANPEHTRSELWMAQDADGDTVLYTGITHNLEGKVVVYSRIEGDQRVFYNLATSAQLSVPLLGDDSTIASWVRAVWRAKAQNTREGYTFVETGSWRGQEISTYENRREPFNIGPPTVIDLYEHVVDRPLLYRSARFEEDEDGNRTLESDHRILEYRLLPVADIPQIQVTPCVEDGETRLAGTCLRY